MSDDNDRATLRNLVDKGGIAMLTTVGDDGQLEARPMALQEFDDAGRLWFFTEFHAPKAEQLQRDPRALVTFSGKNFVSIQGTASVVQDPARQQELWDKAVEAWMQCEPTDARVALIAVDASGAQYWESPGVAPGLISVVAAAVKGERPNVGENEKLDL